VADPELVRQIMVKDFNKFSERKQLGNVEHEVLDLNLAQVTGDRWKRIRSLVSPTFTSGKMRRMFPIVLDCVHVLLDTIDKRLDSGSEMDVKSVFGGFTLEVIGSAAFATKTNTQENPDHPFIDHAKKVFNINPFRLIAGLVFPLSVNKALNIKSVFGQKSIEYYIELTRHIIKKRKNENKDKYHDFLQLMINAENIDENYRDEDDKLDSHHVNEGNLHRSNQSIEANYTLFIQAKKKLEPKRMSFSPTKLTSS